MELLKILGPLVLKILAVPEPIGPLDIAFDVYYVPLLAVKRFVELAFENIPIPLNILLSLLNRF